MWPLSFSSLLIKLLIGLVIKYFLKIKMLRLINKKQSKKPSLIVADFFVIYRFLSIIKHNKAY